MNAFLCAFAAILAVANANGYHAGYSSHQSGPVVAGKAYQLLPAVSVHSIAPSAGYSSAGSYGSSYGGYGAAPSYDINALIAAAGGHISPEQAAKLALYLPSAGAPLIDLSGVSYGHQYAPASYGKLAYAVHDKSYSHHAPEYKAPVATYSAPAHKPEYKAPVAYKAPVEYKAPAATYSAPAYKAPAATYSAPAYKAPAATYSAPAYKAPAATYSAPAYKAPAEYKAPAYKAPSHSYSAQAKASYPSAAAAVSHVAGKSYSAPAAAY